MRLKACDKKRLKSNSSLMLSWVTFCNWDRTSDWYNELVGHEFETPTADHAIEMQNLLQM